MKRISLIGRVMALACLAAVALPIFTQSPYAQTAGVASLDQIVVTVSDLQRTERFYHDGLGFETVDRGELAGDGFAHLVGVPSAKAKTLIMQVGAERVRFVQYLQPGRRYPEDSRSPDLWFQHFAIIVSDMDKAYARLKAVRFEAISNNGPVTLPPQNGDVKAFKFRDPDGHPLELLYFPPGQGRAVWHRPTKKLFLGIDHSAIGVSDSDRSKGLYERLLGMSIAYQGINRGPSQEHLDGTFGAVVRITGLRPTATDGAGVEFLEYLTPPTGRPAPPDARSNDLAHVELEFTVKDLDGLVSSLRAAHTPFVSPDVVELTGRIRAAMVRDPDGHAILLEEMGDR